MKLLDASQTKTEKDKLEAQRIEDLRKLNEELSIVTKKLNTARELEKKQMAEIDQTLAEYRKSTEVERKRLDATLTPLRKEITDLEARRTELMKPVDELLEKAKEVLESNEKESANIRIESAELNEKAEQLSDRLESVIDREDAVKEKESDLEKREQKLVLAEAENERSTKKLTSEWVEFHAKVNEVNESLQRREKEVADGQQVNESVRLANEKESARLRDEKRAIRDGYVALEQAKQHLGIK